MVEAVKFMNEADRRRVVQLAWPLSLNGKEYHEIHLARRPSSTTPPVRHRQRATEGRRLENHPGQRGGRRDVACSRRPEQDRDASRQQVSASRDHGIDLSDRSWSGAHQWRNRRPIRKSGRPSFAWIDTTRIVYVIRRARQIAGPP